ncbi:MAG: hypothetical protein CM1200mP20_09090 [Pseudomonadota bacterium]|nr:MAG: hypothetical protein CM1200mP20_09090 [Pseudomonadota bacterium]
MPRGATNLFGKWKNPLNTMTSPMSGTSPSTTRLPAIFCATFILIFRMGPNETGLHLRLASVDLPELEELLLEAGFSRTVVHWEGTDPKTGEGNGEYRPPVWGTPTLRGSATSQLRNSGARGVQIFPQNSSPTGQTRPLPQRLCDGDHTGRPISAPCSLSFRQNDLKRHFPVIMIGFSQKQKLHEVHQGGESP